MFSMFKKQATSPSIKVEAEKSLSSDQRATFAKKFMGKLAGIESQVVGIHTMLSEMMRGANSAAPAIVMNVAKVSAVPVPALAIATARPHVPSATSSKEASYITRVIKGGKMTHIRLEVPTIEASAMKKDAKTLCSREFLEQRRLVPTLSQSRRISELASEIMRKSGYEVGMGRSGPHKSGKIVRVFPTPVLWSALKCLRVAGVKFQKVS